MAAVLLTGACRVEPRATVAVERRPDGLLGVPLVVNGSVIQAVLDTGAERTVLALGTADRLRLRRDEWVSTDIEGAGGRDRRRLGRPDSLALGGLALRRRTVAADNSVVVGPLPGGVEALLGQDMLSPYDLDLDASAGRLVLMAVDGCTGRFLPWQARYEAIAAWRPVRNVLAVPMQLGAAALWAQLDTGAARSVITLPGMIALGLGTGGSATIRGFGAGSAPARVQRFTVRIGGLPATDTDMLVSPLHTLRSLGALLGADWLAGRHVWISWATDQVFVQTGPALR